MKHQFSYRQIDILDVHACDLSEVIQDACDDGLEVEAYTVTVYSEDGMRQHPEAATAVWLPSERRLGIAWGSDATWGDAADVETGIEMWLNNPQAWEQAN